MIRLKLGFSKLKMIFSQVEETIFRKKLGDRVGSLGCDGGCAGDLGGGLHSDGGHDEGPGGGGCCNIGWSWSLSSRKKEMEEKTHTLLAYHRYHMAFFTKL